MMMVAENVAEKHSMYRGLDDLQAHFLSEEIRKDHNRSSSVLRRIAKRKAIVQRIKWFLSDVVNTTILFAFTLAFLVSILVFFL